jgi:hypothetical protein
MCFVAEVLEAFDEFKSCIIMGHNSDGFEVVIAKKGIGSRSIIAALV